VNRRHAAALLALGVLLGAVPRTAAAQTSPRILVMPFENLQRDGRIFWLTEAAAVLLADDLNALGANAITRQERQRAFERLQVPPAAALTDATIIRIGQIVGADRVVVGALQLDAGADSTLVVRARSIALDSGRVQASASSRGALPDLYGIFEQMARELAGPSARAPEVASARLPPVAAFESFIKGLLAETPDTAVNYLEAALATDPSFDRARLALSEVFSDQGEYDEALDAVRPVRDGSPLARRAHFLAGLSLIELKKYDEAFSTFKALDAGQPSAAVSNDLGVVQIRRGSTPQSGQATYFFKRAADADPDDPDYVFNLGYAYWMERDTQAAIFWLREAVRRAPTDGEAHYVLGVALAAAGSSVEAAREKELARRLSSTFAQWDKRPPAEAVPKGLERIKSDVELPHARRIEAKLASSEQRDQAELAQFYLESGRRQFERENDREASAELSRALYLSPYLAEAHLLLGRLRLRDGRIAEAIDELKIALWSTETAEAHAALGEAYRQNQDLAAARAEADRALALDPKSDEARQLLARINGR
jgi:tetratricopeptide (TPR) repeat protein